MNKERIKQRVIEIIQWWPVIGLLMLISAIPFGWSWYQYISLWVLGSGLVVEYITCKEWKQIRWDRSKWIYVVMLFLFVLPYIRQYFDPAPPSDYFGHQMRIHEWMGIVGAIGLIGFSRKLRMQHIAFVLLITSVVMALYCVYLMRDVSWDNWTLALQQYDQLRRLHINSHMVMNLYINTAVICGLWWVHQTQRWWSRLLIVLAIFVSLSVVLLSSGRTGQLSGLLILYGYILYHLRHKNWAWYVLAFLMIGTSVWGLLQVNARFNTEKISNDPRFAVWDYAVRQIDQEPLWGYGYSTLDSTYMKGLYTDSVAYYGFTRTIISQKEFAVQGMTLCTHHPHNAFLLYWLAMGLPGLVGLILLFGTAIAMPMKPSDKFFLCLFLLAWFMQCMTEPLGDHILPQFVCLMLFALQRTLCTIPYNSDKEN